MCLFFAVVIWDCQSELYLHYGSSWSRMFSKQWYPKTPQWMSFPVPNFKHPRITLFHYYTVTHCNSQWYSQCCWLNRIITVLNINIRIYITITTDIHILSVYVYMYIYIFFCCFPDLPHIMKLVVAWVIESPFCCYGFWTTNKVQPLFGLGNPGYMSI